MRAGEVGEQEARRVGDRPWRRAVSQPSGAWRPPALGEPSKPGMPPAASVSIGPAETRLTRDAARDRGRARGSARPTRARPWRRPSSRRPARRPSRRSPGPTMLAAGSRLQQRQQRDRAARCSEYGAGLEGGRWRSPRGVSRKLPPSASAGAKAIACRTPSSAPQRSPSVARERPRGPRGG